MRTPGASLRGAELDIAAAFPAGTAEKLVAPSALRQPTGVFLRRRFLPGGERRDTLPYQLVQLTLVRFLEQTSAAGLSSRLHQSVILTAATEHGGSSICVFPSPVFTVSGCIFTLSGSSKLFSS